MACVWKILLARLDSFVCVPCLAHISTLLLKDTAKIYWIDKVLTQTKEVALFFRSLFIKYSAKLPINFFFLEGKNADVEYP